MKIFIIRTGYAGTDGAASGGSLDMWKEMRAALKLHTEGLAALKVLEMATVNGAKALNINAGAYLTSSNLISSLVSSTSGCDVKTSIVGGEILMEDYMVKIPIENIENCGAGGKRRL